MSLDYRALVTLALRQRRHDLLLHHCHCHHFRPMIKCFVTHQVRRHYPVIGTVRTLLLERVVQSRYQAKTVIVRKQKFSYIIEIGDDHI